MPSDDVQIRLRMLGAAVFSRDAKKASTGLASVGKGGREAATGMGRAQGPANKLRAELGRVQGAARSAASALSPLKTVIAGAATAGGLGFAAAAKSSVDFEQQMANVQSRLQTTGGNMDKLTAQALDLGAKTQFSAGEAAGGMDELAAAGFSTQQILKSLPGTLALAAASGTDLAASAELQGAAIRGFGLKASAAGHVADVLALTVNKSALEMSDLAETLPYVASTARQTGTSFEQVAAAAGILGNAGIKGSMAGTALRTSMLRLTDPTQKMGGVLEQMGISSKELAAIPLPKVIARVAEGLKKLPTRGEKVGAISAIFGKEAAPSMLNLMSKGSAGINRFVTALEHSQGAAKKAADIQRNTVKGAFDNLTGSIETASITLTRKYLPAVKKALNAGAGGINGFTEGLTGAKPTRTFTRNDQGRVTGVKDTTSGSQRAGSQVRNIATSALKAIGGVVKDVAPGLKDATAQFVDAIKPAVPFLQNVLLPVLEGIGKGVLGGVVSAFKVAIPVIKIIATVLGAVGTAARPLRPVLQGVGMVIGFLFGGTILRAVGALGKLGGSFRIIGPAVRLLLLPLRIATGAIRVQIAVVGRLAGAFGRAFTFVQRFVGTFSSAPARVLRGGLNMIGGLVSALERAPGKAARIARTVASRLAGALSSGASTVATGAGKVGMAIVNGIVNAIKASPGAIVGAITSIIPDKLKGAANSVLGGALDLVGARAGGGVINTPLTLVGERGPELVAGGQGSRVFTAQQTRGMLGGGGMPSTIHVTLVAAEGGRALAHGIASFEALADSTA